MAGINLAKQDLNFLTESRKLTGIKCIFLSHQQKDKEVCSKIADYLMNANIDVYFDEYDLDLKIYRQSNRPEGVVNSIKKGINNSSHTLVVVSRNTMNSTWVPWEIGYGYDKTHLGVLTLKGITNESLPDYLKTAPLLIRGTKSLNEYLSSITNSSVNSMQVLNLVEGHTKHLHPLDNYLDWDA